MTSKHPINSCVCVSFVLAFVRQHFIFIEIVFHSFYCSHGVYHHENLIVCLHKVFFCVFFFGLVLTHTKQTIRSSHFIFCFSFSRTAFSTTELYIDWNSSIETHRILGNLLEKLGLNVEFMKRCQVRRMASYRND